MHCINTSSPEYKELLESTKLKDEILSAKIAVWQTKTGDLVNFPTKDELLTYESRDTISNQLREDVIEELSGLDKEGLSLQVDKVFKVVDAHWKRLGYSKYVDIRKIFNNPTVGNEFKALWERLDEVVKKTNDGVQFEQKVRGFALGLQQLNNLIDKTQQRIKETDFKSMDEQEALAELSKHLMFLNEWRYTTEELQKDFKGSPVVLSMLYQINGNIRTTIDILNESREYAVVNSIVDSLEPTLNIQRKKYEEDVARVRKARANAAKRGDTNSVDNYNKRLEQLKADFDKIKVEASDVLEYLTGKRGDTNTASALFEALMNSPDPVTFAAKKRITDLIDEVYQKARGVDFALQRELAPLLKKLNAGRFNVFDFNKQFVQEVNRTTKDGRNYKELELMNEFSGGWQDKIDSFNAQLEEARAKGDEQLYKQIKMDFAKWRVDYMHQEYKDEVYKRYELWNDDVGQEAYARRQEIFDDINSIVRKLRPTSSEGFDLTEDEEIELEEELFKLQRLGSIYDENGKLKEGIEYDIALRIQEYNKKTRDLFEYKPRVGAFERALDRFKQAMIATGLSETSAQFVAEVNDWLEENTRTVIKPEFYVERQKILNKLNYIISKVRDKSDQDKVKSFSESWERIFSQLKGYRDSDGQPVGTQLSEGKTAAIKQELEYLESLKSSLEGLSGLTEDESNELNGIWKLIKLKIPIDDTQKARKKELEKKRKSMGLSERETQEFYDLINELKELQTRIPTPYYLDQLNQITAPLGKVYSLITAEDLLTSPELDELLKDPNFEDWFNKNHIEVSRYNPNTKIKEPMWERLYTWNKIVPIDNDYYETTTLADGTVIQGVPSHKYFYREIKEQYKTEKIEGVTVDNRGRFLPKSYDKNGKLEAADESYINKDYYNLKNSTNEDDKTKFQILEVYKKYLLKAQEDLPYQDRLWYKIPTIRKRLSERIRSGDFKGVKNALLERFNLTDSTSVDEEDNNKKQPTKEELKVVKADLFGNELLEIPIKFTGVLASDNVSLNIANSIIQYTLSSESKKVLMEEHPLIQALEDMLESYGKYSTTKIKNAVKRLQNVGRVMFGAPALEITQEPVKDESSYQRLENIRNLQDAYFKGIYKRGFFTRDRGAASILVDTVIINPLMRLAGFGIMSLDFAGALTNSLSGNTYALLDGITGRSFSIKDYILAVRDFHSKLLPAFMGDLDQELGKKSLWAQLFDLYDPQQEITSELGKRYTTNRWLKIGEEAKQFFLNPRKFGELQISASIQLAIMNNVRVKDATGKLIPITQAYEIGGDGLIKLKDGVEFSQEQFNSLKNSIRQAIRETQGNYAKQDKTEAEKYSVGAMLFFMRRYLVPLFLDAWQTRRFNGNGGSREGYNITAFKVLKLGYEGIRDRTNYWETLSRTDKSSLVKAMAFWSSTLLFALLIAQIDPEEEKKKYKKLKQWSWLRLQFLLQAVRVKSEVEQMTLYGGYNEFLKTFKNPFMLGNKLSQMGGLVENIGHWIADDDKARYSSKGGYKQMMKDVYGTDNKALISFYKMFGYRGGGVEAFLPGSEKSQQTSAYRVKQTVEAQDRR